MEQVNNRFDAQNVVNGSLDYYLFGPIGVDDYINGISGQAFANDMDFINRFLNNEVTQINIRINSTGGSIVEGLGMISAIRNSKIPIDTYIEGVAASMAFVVAMAGRKRFAVDFSRAMIHDPHFDSEQLSESDRAVLLEFKNMLISIFKNNSKLTSEEIDEIMSKETWFDANQMLENKLIDSIVNTERNLGLFGNSAKTILKFVNTLKNEKTKVFDMKKLFAKLSELGRIKNDDEQPEKVETAAVETITELTNTNEELEKDNAELAKTNEELEKENEALKAENESLKADPAPDSSAVEAVENAIKSGKIEPGKKDEMLKVAKNNLEVFKQIISTIPAKVNKITNKIVFGGNEIDVDNSGKVNGKTLRQLEKENPALVSEIFNNNREMYNKMYFAQYGKKPTN